MSKTKEPAEPTTRQAIKKRLTEIVNEQIEQLPALLEQLPAPDRLRAIIDLLPYCAPKISPAPHDYDEFLTW